jgi:hypothetical protein
MAGVVLVELDREEGTRHNDVLLDPCALETQFEDVERRGVAEHCY